MGEGVEWGLHCCLALVWLEDQGPVPTGRLAEIFDLPPAYLKKRLQPLVRAGILASEPGARGGYRLARAPERVTIMDVVTAIEGPAEAFRCTEIRQRGAGTEGRGAEFSRPCGIATVMRQAELAWRRELAGQTLADLLAATPVAASRRVRRFHERLSS
ncbi:MAG TPA: Rrf2 family transcriptional regulator [Nonomuraea sp.]|nr:Rrf2 family transcriptional regulator [Nonomuraea sp.]